MCVCMCVRERGGTLRLTGSFIEENTVAACSEQTVKCVTQTLEEEFPSHLVHIWELAQHPPLLWCRLLVEPYLCSTLHFSTVPPWILVA